MEILILIVIVIVKRVEPIREDVHGDDVAVVTVTMYYRFHQTDLGCV